MDPLAAAAMILIAFGDSMLMALLNAWARSDWNVLLKRPARFPALHSYRARVRWHQRRS